MRAKSFEGMVCSIATVLDAVGDRWAMLILRDLVLGLRRYDDLRRSTGIANATLADRLRQLEQNGLIERRPYQSGPDRHEYLPTAKGRDITGILAIQGKTRRVAQAVRQSKSFEDRGHDRRQGDINADVRNTRADQGVRC